MFQTKNRWFPIFSLAVIGFCIISLACGSSTSQKLASAVPPTVEQSQPSAAVPSTDKPQVKQPTATKAIQSSPTPQPEALEITSQGLGQKESELGYGFFVKNPNTNYAFENSQYQVAFYNAEGTVVETDSGYLDLILPGQELGVAGSAYLDDGVTVAKINVQINPGNAVVSNLTDTFSTDKVTYIPDDNYPYVRGVISNPYNKDITNIRVSVLLLNDASEIIGGGYTYLNFINASTSTGVSISVTSNGNVSRTELYPSLSGLSELETSGVLPSDAESITLSKQGFGQNDTLLGIGLIINNPNQAYSVENSMYHLTAYAEDGSVLGVSEGYINLLLPTQTLGVAEEIYLDDGVNVARLDAQLKPGTYNASDPLPMFTYENATYLPDDYFPQVTGEVVSPYAKDITTLRVSALAYNEAGEIIGSGYTYLDFVPANSKSAVSVNVTTAGTPTTVEIYSSITSLSDIEE